MNNHLHRSYSELIQYLIESARFSLIVDTSRSFVFHNISFRLHKILAGSTKYCIKLLKKIIKTYQKLINTR